MTIHAVGNEQDSYHFCPYVSFFTDAAGAGVDYNASALGGGQVGIDFPALSECWVHMRLYRGIVGVGSSTMPLLSLSNSSTGKDALRIYSVPTTGFLDFAYNNTGTTYTTIDSRSFGDTNLIELDFYFKRGASGVLKAWVNGCPVISKSGTYNTVDATWNRLVLTGYSVFSSARVQWSDVIVSTVPLFRASTETLKPSAGGSVSGWTGAYTNLLDVSGANDDTTAVHTDTVADSFTMAYENMATLAACRQVNAVSIAGIAGITLGASISSVAFYARHASTNYTLDSLGAAAGGGSVRSQQVLETNPAGGAWSESDVNNIQFGAITS